MRNLRTGRGHVPKCELGAELLALLGFVPECGEVVDDGGHAVFPGDDLAGDLGELGEGVFDGGDVEAGELGAGFGSMTQRGCGGLPDRMPQ